MTLVVMVWWLSTIQLVFGFYAEIHIQLAISRSYSRVPARNIERGPTLKHKFEQRIAIAAVALVVIICAVGLMVILLM